MNLKLGQSFHDFHRFQADSDDLQEKIKRVTFVAHLGRVIVEVIHDT